MLLSKLDQINWTGESQRKHMNRKPGSYGLTVILIWYGYGADIPPITVLYNGKCATRQTPMSVYKLITDDLKVCSRQPAGYQLWPAGARQLWPRKQMGS